MGAGPRQQVTIWKDREREQKISWLGREYFSTTSMFQLVIYLLANKLTEKNVGIAMDYYGRQFGTSRNETDRTGNTIRIEWAQ